MRAATNSRSVSEVSDRRADARRPAFEHPWLRKGLLGCGVLAALLFVAMNVIAAMWYPGYNWSSQTVSELSAVGAPTRTMWTAWGAVYNLLVIAFGWGIWLSSSRSRELRIVSVVTVGSGLIGFAWPPMHTREVLAAGGGTLTDTLHIAFTVAAVLLMVAAIGLAAAPLGKRFRIYSYLTILILITFGAMTGAQSSQLEANLPTPMIGVWERINIAAYLMWLIVLAGRIWKAPLAKVNS
jgi:hypothetical protein